MLLLLALTGLMGGIAVYSIAMGAYAIPLWDVLAALSGKITGPAGVVITSIRLPRVVAAMVCGWGLSVSGLCLQSVLKNPLGSPATLGISQGAAFGAALSIVVFGAKLFSVTTFAFAGAMGAMFIILILAGIKRLAPEAVILTGVALSALFSSATALIQYLATEIQLAIVIFWTFGDVGRSNWREILILSGVTAAVTLYLMARRWDLNAMMLGEDNAKGLGVNVERTRIISLLAVSLICALATAFHGVIAFVGLIAPHISRKLVGEDHGILIPFSSVIGALILLCADTLGRVILGSGALPVGIITSFLGAPMFLYLLIRRHP
ncbi:MAG: iron ABC transporter permease [Desulfobacteraceae bacterium]|nr:iron ABC transporter permease [Desulfobacteraceae bacterium]MBU4054056.1 iron ABC transporter permease [Pseudomonadota bacterium]